MINYCISFFNLGYCIQVRTSLFNNETILLNLNYAISSFTINIALLEFWNNGSLSLKTFNYGTPKNPILDKLKWKWSQKSVLLFPKNVL